MPERKMVWIVEHNHVPLVRAGRIVAFSVGGEGTNAVRKFLNSFHCDDAHYYDAVLYETREQTPNAYWKEDVD